MLGVKELKVNFANGGERFLTVVSVINYFQMINKKVKPYIIVVSLKFHGYVAY